MNCIFEIFDSGPGTVVSHQNGENDEVLNLPKYTSAEIFGKDDASDEDEEDPAVETESDGKKRKIVERSRHTEQQKFDIAQHSHENPLLSQKELIEWSLCKFDM